MRTLSLLALLVMLGCPRPLPPEGEWRPVPGAPTERSVFSEEQVKRTEQKKLEAHVAKMRAALVTPEEQACQSDADCELTSFHCCNCSSGGQMVAVHREKLPEIIRRRGVICDDYACAQVVSAHPSCAAEQAVCRGGTCMPLAPESAPPGAGGVGVEKIPEEPSR